MSQSCDRTIHDVKVNGCRRSVCQVQGRGRFWRQGDHSLLPGATGSRKNVPGTSLLWSLSRYLKIKKVKVVALRVVRRYVATLAWEQNILRFGVHSPTSCAGNWDLGLATYFSMTFWCVDYNFLVEWKLKHWLNLLPDLLQEIQSMWLVLLPDLLQEIQSMWLVLLPDLLQKIQSMWLVFLPDLL